MLFVASQGVNFSAMPNQVMTVTGTNRARLTVVGVIDDRRQKLSRPCSAVEGLGPVGRAILGRCGPKALFAKAA